MDTEQNDVIPEWRKRCPHCYQWHLDRGGGVSITSSWKHVVRRGRSWLPGNDTPGIGLACIIQHPGRWTLDTFMYDEIR